MIGHTRWHAMHWRPLLHARQRPRSTAADPPSPQSSDSILVGVCRASVGQTSAHRLQSRLQCAGRSSSIGVHSPERVRSEVLGRSAPVGHAL